MTQDKKLMLTSVSVLLALLASSGCAKKAKPDNSSMMDTNIANKDMSFEATGSDGGQITGLASIHFDYDKSNLTSEARDILVQDAKWLKKHRNDNLEIQGHTDRHGSEEYNLALGQRRAITARNYMIHLGIKKSRLTTISYGKERLLDTAETDEADAKNRRDNFKPIETVKNSLTKN